MQEPPLAANEAPRLDALRAAGLLGPGILPALQPYARIARDLCDVPIAAVSVIDHDRQWFKAVVGLDVDSTPRRTSFCAHAIMSTGVLYLPDATEDARFADNPLVLGPPHIRFYAGCPLFLEGDLGVGALLVVDRRPRRLSEKELLRLMDVAELVRRELSGMASSGGAATAAA